MNAIVVSCCQVAPALRDLAANRELNADAISRAAAQGASVILLPELVSSGYVFNSRTDAKASAEAADGATVTPVGAPCRRPRRRHSQIAHHVGKLGALGFEVTLCRTPEPQPDGTGQTQAA